MHDVLFVRGLETLRDLAGDLDRLGHGDRAAIHAIRQILPLDQLHDQEPHLRQILEPVDGCDVRMLQAGEHAGFTMETGDPLRIPAHLAREDLQGDITVELRVTSAIDFAHPAFADELEHLVVGERLSDQDGVPRGRGSSETRLQGRAGQSGMAGSSMECQFRRGIPTTPTWTAPELILTVLGPSVSTPIALKCESGVTALTARHGRTSLPTTTFTRQEP